MPYVEGFDRDQAMILSWGDVVAPDSEARLVDALVDSLDLESPGFGSAAAEGGPRYSPRDPLKLYVWGYRRGIRSSRRLAESCRTNVEAIWMLSGLRPDFRTVADFREGHASDMGKVLHALNERLAGAVEWGFCSVDGSKVTASNPKMRNLTAHKLDDRTTWLDAHAKEYLRKLDKIDAMGEPDESDPLTRETIGANLGAGVLPHVIADDGADAHEVELPFEPAEGLDPSSTDPAEISRCLRAGVVPDACAGTVEVSEVRDVKRKVVDEPAPTPEPYGSHEEMAARAAGGCFVRDPGRNLVVCPAGETLRQKGVKKSGAMRHANKTACGRCPHRDRCYRGKQEWKEMDLAKDQLEKPCRPWHGAAGTKPDRREIPKGRYHFETTSTAILRVKPDVARTTLRTGISEHPFGTIKTAMGGGHLLLRGLGNAEAEFSLVCLGYNIRRAANLLGFGRLMELMGSFLALLRAALLSAGSSQSQNQSQTWLLTC